MDLKTKKSVVSKVSQCKSLSMMYSSKSEYAKKQKLDKKTLRLKCPASASTLSKKSKRKEKRKQLGPKLPIPSSYAKETFKNVSLMTL